MKMNACTAVFALLFASFCLTEGIKPYDIVEGLGGIGRMLQRHQSRGRSYSLSRYYGSRYSKNQTPAAPNPDSPSGPTPSATSVSSSLTGPYGTQAATLNFAEGLGTAGGAAQAGLFAPLDGVSQLVSQSQATGAVSGPDNTVATATLAAALAPFLASGTSIAGLNTEFDGVDGIGRKLLDHSPRYSRSRRYGSRYPTSRTPVAPTPSAPAGPTPSATSVSSSVAGSYGTQAATLNFAEGEGTAAGAAQAGLFAPLNGVSELVSQSQATGAVSGSDNTVATATLAAALAPFLASGTSIAGLNTEFDGVDGSGRKLLHHYGRGSSGARPQYSPSKYYGSRYSTSKKPAAPTPTSPTGPTPSATSVSNSLTGPYGTQAATLNFAEGLGTAAGAAQAGLFAPLNGVSELVSQSQAVGAVSGPDNTVVTNTIAAALAPFLASGTSIAGLNIPIPDSSA